MNKLSLLKSDLKDTRDPKVLAKYPHLDNDELREQIKRRITEEEKRLRDGTL